MSKKQIKPKYNLTVQIGKKVVKGKVFKFKTDNPVESLLGIKIPKLTEGVAITLEKDKKKATRSLLSFKARRVFNNKLDAFYFIKTMNWILK